MLLVEIRVKGQVNRDWSDWFDGLHIKHSADGSTLLLGSVRDQAELRGILSRLADLGLELISVNTLSGQCLPKGKERGGGERKIKNSSLQSQTRPSLIITLEGEK